MGFFFGGGGGGDGDVKVLIKGNKCNYTAWNRLIQNNNNLR